MQSINGNRLKQLKCTDRRLITRHRVNINSSGKKVIKSSPTRLISHRLEVLRLAKPTMSHDK